MAILLVQKREDGQWEVMKEGGKRASSVEKYKKDAVAKAEEYLKERGEIEKVIVYKSSGHISTVKTLQEDGEIHTTSSIDRTTMKDRDFKDYTLSYPVWKDRFQSDKRLTEKDIGRRVHVAGEPNTEKAYLFKVHEPGEEGWPEGGYEVRRKGLSYPTNHFFEEVILHRSEQ